jgi:hypothetical protein
MTPIWRSNSSRRGLALARTSGAEFWDIGFSPPDRGQAAR